MHLPLRDAVRTFLALAHTEQFYFMAPAVDRISNLPKNVTEAILMHLPLRDAVRTSILSRYWRYEWNKLSQLVFDENCIPYPKGKAHKKYDKKLIEIVNQVLFLHPGPIRKFTLKVKLERGGDIDRYILYVSRNGIKEFSFETIEGGYYKVPSCLYLCEELTYLLLCGCTISLPASFKGFSRLTTLTLCYVDIPNKGLESLISFCPLLTKLDLAYINGCDHLNICALKLVEMTIDVEFEDVCFVNTPLLAILSITLRISEDRVVSDGASCKLTQVLGRQPRIERLELFGRTLPIFSEGDVPSMLPTALRLKYLSIDLNFEDRQQMLAARCIFRSSPILQELCIKASSSKNTAEFSFEDFWEAQKAFDCSFSRLQTVELTNFTGTESELKFVEFVLASAPVLENLQIELEQEVPDALSFVKEMNGFQRVSAKAKLVFTE